MNTQRTSPGSRLLLLLRHAKAVAAAPGLSQASDHARALSDRGRADAVAVGALLRSRALLPERALVSSSRRTRETFELLGSLAAAAPDPVLSDALYLAGPRTMLELLRDRGGEARSMLLIGHNPGLQELASMLAVDDRTLRLGFPTCMLALYAIEGAWAELAPGQATLLDLFRP